MKKIFIRDVLRTRSIKPSEFAERLGVKRLALYRWMTGERKWPLEKALLAARLLEIPPDNLEFAESKTEMASGSCP